MSISGPSAPNDIRFVASTTTVPTTALRISAAIASTLENGAAMTTIPASVAAARFDAATCTPVAAATEPASSGSRDAMTTVWPARANDVASERPTLPAPMMAISTVMYLRLA